MNTTSNYKKKHLDTVHNTIKLEAIIPEVLQDRKRKENETDDEQKQSDSKRQCTKTSDSPGTIRTLVEEYIISDMVPLSTVDSPAFKSWSICSVDMPNKKSLALHLEKAHESMMAKLKKL